MITFKSSRYFNQQSHIASHFTFPPKYHPPGTETAGWAAEATTVHRDGAEEAPQLPSFPGDS